MRAFLFRQTSLTMKLCGFLILTLVFSSLLLLRASGQTVTSCQRHFRGIEYCTVDDGKSHIVTIDLSEPTVRFDMATAGNAVGPNPPAWSAGYRQTVAQMAETHPTLDDLPLAMAINGDYGASDGSHGWEGFLVQRGKRLDGPTMNRPDCDCTPFDRSTLSLSRSKPTRAEISLHSPAELDAYDAYKTRCTHDPAFAACKATVLNRASSPDEVTKFQAALQDRWYTVVGGGPIIIEAGQPIPISEACRMEKFRDDWCADTPRASADRMRQLHMNTVAGVTADGGRLILIVTTARLPNEAIQLLAQRGAYSGIRFDGSKSSQFWYNDLNNPAVSREKTGNTRRISNALLVYAAPLPLDDAQVAERIWPIVVLPGETFQITIAMRNEGRATWRASEGYALVNVKDPLAGAMSLPLPRDVPPGDTVAWLLTLTTPGHVGQYSSEWQLHHGHQPFGLRARVSVTVLPEQARSWRNHFQRWLDERKRDVEHRLQELIANLEREMSKHIEKELQSLCSGAWLAGLLGLAGVWLSKR